MKFLARVRDGKPDLGSDYNKARFKEFCQKNEGKVLYIEKPELKRSLRQNAFYWFYLSIIAGETGNDPEDLHEFLKTKLLPKKIIKIKGRKGVYDVVKYKSTTELSKLEFGEYMERICVLTEVPIPDPEAAGFFTK